MADPAGRSAPPDSAPGLPGAVERVGHLVVGAGVTGLSYANFLPDDADWQVIEQLHEPGGYCRTIHQDGFVWDFSGHFFHFRHADIEQFLRDRMPAGEVSTIARSSGVLFAGRRIDFPFQKNIHQLPIEDFIDCLHDLYFRQGDAEAAQTFEEMLYARLGRGIVERFLRPYNEKLYACPLSHMDKDAMGRFFPHADIGDIIANMRHPDGSSYNASFTYPRGGAIEYVKALLHDLDPGRIHYNERLEAIDLERKIARTSRRTLAFDKLISAAPFPHLLHMCGKAWDPEVYTWNKVLVFNLGFDTKGQDRDHWLYIPEREFCFYRVGFYDNIFAGERMSLYVEIGLSAEAEVDADAWLPKVLADLKRCGIVDQQRLLSHHSVVLDPAYVHLNQASRADFASRQGTLESAGVHSIGRYGGWTYCSIEDNMLEARGLARDLGREPPRRVG